MPSQCGLCALLVGVHHDVVIVHAVGWPKAHHAAGGQPFAGNDFLQHFLAFGKDTRCHFAHHLILQNRGVAAGQIPSLEERRPVDKGH